MLNNNNFVWTDNRNGNFDIYYYVEYISKVDLKLLDINLSGNLQPLKTKNLLEITVENNGDAIAKNIKMNISFSFKDGNNTYAENIFEIENLFGSICNVAAFGMLGSVLTPTLGFICGVVFRSIEIAPALKQRSRIRIKVELSIFLVFI
jgi:hypothetical protein